MYRRRRQPGNKIVFGFDSFMDIVANVIGIILRLILVAWVGSRTYTATMKYIDDDIAAVDVADLPAPKATDDPLYDKIQGAGADLEEARRRLREQLGFKSTVEQKSKSVARELDLLTLQSKELDKEILRLQAEVTAKGKTVQLASLSAEELRRRGQELLAHIRALEKTPLKTKALYFHAPVSRIVDGDEMFFECRGGRVAFIDVAAFLNEVQRDMDNVADALKTQSKLVRHTSTVGAFRMRYAFERELGLLDSPERGFRYGLSEWTIEPVVQDRGESVQAALTPQSQFRRVADAIDPNQSVATFWVYQDSFEIFRQLRDYLFEKDVQVAGRPLPMDAPIAASRKGTKSRGQ